MKQFSKGNILISKNVQGVTGSRRVTAEVCGIDGGSYQLAIHQAASPGAPAKVSMALDVVHRDFELESTKEGGQPSASVWARLLMNGDGHGG